MFNRKISQTILRAIATFPAVVVTGARQTGKTTLCKTLLRDSHAYVSLEDPDVRRFAVEDPRGFLQTHRAPLILDEIQYAPELPSYLQGMIDENRQRYGQFVLTGSQNFLLMKHVAQSLAGRAAVLSLYPCSLREVYDLNANSVRHRLCSFDGVCDWILRGGYPELRSRPELDRKLWCASYVRLFLERDVRKILNVDDLGSFERFVHLCALRTGQILNLADLARDADVAPPTAKRWLSVLESSYQVHLLKPYFSNTGKRLVKSPKLYFADTALASYLMGLHDAETLLKGPQFGALFETAVVMEAVKTRAEDNENESLFFLNVQGGVEIDLLLENANSFDAFEIKSGLTPSPRWGDALVKGGEILKKPATKTVLSVSDRRQNLSSGVRFLPWFEIQNLLSH